MNFPRYGVMVASINNRLYAIGGLNNQNQAVNIVEEYIPELDSWVLKAPMPTPCAHGVCVPAYNKIYIVGGVIRQNMPIESCMVFDPLSNQWYRKRKMPSKRSGINGAIVGDTIYICGGYFSAQQVYTDTVECYNISRDSWFIRSSMNTSRVEFGAATLNGKLYTIGGLFYSNYLNINEEYDPATDNWIIKSPIPLARSGLVCISYQNRIYAIGGQRHAPHRTFYSRVDIFNPQDSIWLIGETLNIARAYAGAAVIGNRIYVVGGLTRGNTITASMEEFVCSGIEESNLNLVNSDILSAHPNPFTNKTILTLMPVVNGINSIDIFDNTGKLIKSIPIIKTAQQTNTKYLWDGTDNHHRPVKSGVYFVQINPVKNYHQRSVYKLIFIKQ
ncbi:MAG: T9SS type A sorting domain-containing protein [candidate division WOR-3 bacterium]